MKRKKLSSSERRGLTVILAVILMMGGLLIGLYFTSEGSGGSSVSVDDNAAISVIPSDSADSEAGRADGETRRRKRAKRAKRARNDSVDGKGSSRDRGRRSGNGKSRERGSAVKGNPRDILADTIPGQPHR